MAASSQQKPPYIAGMVCAGKGKDLLDRSHENGLSMRVGGAAAAVGQEDKVHGSPEHSQGHDTCAPSVQRLTPHRMTGAMHSL